MSSDGTTVKKATYISDYSGRTGTITGLEVGKPYAISFFSRGGETETVTNGTDVQTLTITNSNCGVIAFTAQGTSVTWSGSQYLSGMSLYSLGD